LANPEAPSARARANLPTNNLEDPCLRFSPRCQPFVCTTLAISGGGRATDSHVLHLRTRRARRPLYGVVGWRVAPLRCSPHLTPSGHDNTFERASLRLAPADRCASPPRFLRPPSPHSRSPPDPLLLVQPAAPLSASPLAETPVTRARRRSYRRRSRMPFNTPQHFSPPPSVLPFSLPPPTQRSA